jgi:hypothetical protein
LIQQATSASAIAAPGPLSRRYDYLDRVKSIALSGTSTMAQTTLVTFDKLGNICTKGVMGGPQVINRIKFVARFGRDYSRVLDPYVKEP